MTALVIFAFLFLTFASIFLKIEYGRQFNTALVSAACTLTGCSQGGAAVVGWLTTLVAPLYVLVAILLWQHWHGIVRAVWGVGAVLLVMVGFQFLQVDYDTGLSAFAVGPGGPALLRGIQWGLGGWGAALGILFLWWLVTALWKGKVGRRGVIGVFVVVLLASSGVAYATAPAPVRYLMTTQIFAEPVIRVGNDTLTRTSATDLQGCGGKYEGCLRTAEFDFTTDDSDAVVRMEIVTLPHNDAAWDAKYAIPETTGDPTTIRVTDVTRDWLMVWTVKHADGRPITAAEERWMRWPARQLKWAFREALGYNEYEPRSTDRSGPRTS